MIRTINEAQIRGKTERFMDYGLGTPCPDRVVLLEVGPNWAFDIIHARRAVQCVPEERDAEIIAFGSDPVAVRARLEALEVQGYRNLFIYEGGKPEWIGDGLWRQSSLLPVDGFAVHDGHVFREGRGQSVPDPQPATNPADASRRSG
jgi:hypothetical protein